LKVFHRYGLIQIINFELFILLIQISDSGVLLDSGKSSQQAAPPLKSPTETRSVHFPIVDLSNESTTNNSSYDQSSTFISSQNVGLSNQTTMNPNVKPVRKTFSYFFENKFVYS
jgi:hypothetical protein